MCEIDPYHFVVRAWYRELLRRRGWRGYIQLLNQPLGQRHLGGGPGETVQATRLARARNYQFSPGLSIFSITKTTTGPFLDCRRSPSCSVMAVKIDARPGRSTSSAPAPRSG